MSIYTLDNLINSFDVVKPADKKVYGIKIDESRIRVCSGKSCWNGIGPLKNALRNHIANRVWDKKESDRLYEELLNSPRFEIVELKEGEA